MTTDKKGNAGRSGSHASAGANPRTIDLEANDMTPTTGDDADAGKESAAPGEMPPEPDFPQPEGSLSDDTADAAGTPETKTVAASSGTGLGRMIASGFAGGLISLFAVGSLNQIGVLQSVPLLSGLAASTDEPVAADTAPTDALNVRLDDLARRLAESEAKLSAQAPQTEGEDQSGRIAMLSNQLDDLFKRVGTLEKNQADSASTPPASGLASTPANAASSADGARIGMLSNQMDDLFKRLKAAEDALANAGPEKGLGQDSAQTAPDAAEIAAMKAEIGDLRKQLETGIADTTARLASETGAIDNRIGELAGKLDTLASETDRKPDSQELVARSVAATALRTAYDRGEPFAPLLASVETLVGTDPAIEALKPFASAGVMTNEQLKSGFSDLVDTMLASVAPKDEGIAARLMANARSLVSVRPAGPVEGNTPEAIVSRIEAGLATGSLASALTEWENLPGPARDASANWAEKLRSRIRADDLMTQVSLLLSAGSAR